MKALRSTAVSKVVFSATDWVHSSQHLQLDHLWSRKLETMVLSSSLAVQYVYSMQRKYYQFLTNSQSRRAGWVASAILILMGLFGKFGALFASMPPSVLGGMQVFLYSTIAVAGIRVLGLIPWSRRDRFILAASLGVGFIDIVQPTWFSQILNYSGTNVHLAGFEQGINLIVETPFVIAAFVGVFLNLVLPNDKSALDARYGDEAKHPVIGEQSD